MRRLSKEHWSPFDIRAVAIVLLFLVFNSSCVPRCTKFPEYAQCKVRMRHLHQGVEFRGVPWYKKQHLQYGEKYKKPHKDGYQEIRSPKNRKKKSKRRVVIRHN